MRPIRWTQSLSALALVAALGAPALLQPAAATAAVSPRERPQSTLRPRVTYRGTRLVTRTVVILPAGRSVPVSIATGFDTRNTSRGDAWSGTVTSPIRSHGQVVVPAGARVRGVVATAIQPHRGQRATLKLALRSVTFGGHTYAARGESQDYIAKSPRTRNVGAIAGGTVAGALIGRAVGHSGKGAVVGGLVGAGATSAAVAASKGYQVEIAAGSTVTLTTSSAIVAKRKVRVPV